MSEIDRYWTNVLDDIKKATTKGNFITFFQNTALLSLENNIAVIAAPSAMIVDLLQKRFQADIKTSLDKHSGNNNIITFVIRSVKPLDVEIKANEKGTLFSEPDVPQKPFIGHLPRVRPDFTFQNFAVSSSNQLAFVSAQTVAKNLGVSYNPFFIYGPVGVGKTHLMHAIANDVYAKNPERKLIYLTSEEFTNEVVEAIRGNDTARMKKKFRSAYLLMIDDIQFIEGKERVQEELFHTFNYLIDMGSQICFSSDRPPHEIKKISDRLSSRFASGLTVDIEAPDFELKSAIILIKAQKYGQEIGIDVAKLLAENAKDTRSLEGLLLRVITQAAATGEEITVELAKRCLGNVIEERRGHIHADDIIKSVCEYFGVKSTQLKGPKRDASIVKARQICMYMLQKELHLTLVEIGNLLGGRDHTTVMHGVEKIEKLVDNKAIITQDIQGITRVLHE